MMREGNISSLFTFAEGGGYPIHGPDGGRGVPHPSSGGGGGYPIPVLDRGYPILLMGDTPIQDHDGGTPPSKTGWDTPHLRLDGVPPVQDWMGYPPQRLDGIPSPPSKI